MKNEELYPDYLQSYAIIGTNRQASNSIFSDCVIYEVKSNELQNRRIIYLRMCSNLKRKF